MKITQYIFLILFPFFTFHCLALIGNPNGYGPTGFIFTNTKIGVSGTKIESNMVRSEACTGTYIFLISSGTGTIEDAARKKNIRKIYLVENEMFGVLGSIYSQMCTVIYGSNEIDNVQFIPDVKNATIVLKTGEKLKNVDFQKTGNFYTIKTSSGNLLEIEQNQISKIEL